MREQKYYAGDKVTLQSDHLSDNPLKGFQKGDHAVILDAIKVDTNLWEIDVEINKNKSSCLVLGKEVKVYQKTPIQIEQKNHIELGKFKAVLTQDETFLLYKKIQNLKEKNKRNCMFNSKPIKFETNEDLDITIRILQKILKPTHHVD